MLLRSGLIPRAKKAGGAVARFASPICIQNAAKYFLATGPRLDPRKLSLSTIQLIATAAARKKNDECF